MLCDIEGTTTSLRFVHDVLFPLSHRKMQEFIETNWQHLEPEIHELEKEIHPAGKEAIVRTLRNWIDADRKHPILKKIQGKIWKDAYEAGEIRGHVYPDVPENFRRWKKEGITIAIFSSGSVEAQQLLFRYSEMGDLTPFIDFYFDTGTGPKKEAESYKKIVDRMGLPASDILFFSDVEEELDAARRAGVQTKKIIRGSDKDSKETDARFVFGF